MKAKFIGYCGYDKYDRYHSPIYEYEYRGHRYFVTDLGMVIQRQWQINTIMNRIELMK